MKVTTISPFGFCMGVTKAIEVAKKAKKEHPNEDVFVIGNLVHNERIIEEIRALGLIVLDEREKSLRDWLISLPEQSVIVFTAHGHAPELDEIASRKKMLVYDSTCVFVKENEEMIKEEIRSGGEIIYIGQRNHAEANGAIGIDESKIHLLVPGESLALKCLHTSEPLVISQTTMAPNEIQESIQEILKIFPKAKIAAKRCTATEIRQRNILKAPKNTDLFLVLGSKTSNNTMKLYEIAKAFYRKADVFRVLGLSELKTLNLSGYQNAVIASGASTSIADVHEIESYLKSINY